MYGKTPYMSMIIIGMIIGIIVTRVRRIIMITIMIGMPMILPRTIRF